MPAKGKVSLVWQTIFCFIPIMDIVASYRVKRLRWYLLIMLAVGIPLSIAMNTISPMPTSEDYDKMFLETQEIDWGYIILGDEPEVAIASWIIYQGIVYALAVYLIRRWSKKWNLQFDAKDLEDN